MKEEDKIRSYHPNEGKKKGKVSGKDGKEKEAFIKKVSSHEVSSI